MPLNERFLPQLGDLLERARIVADFFKVAIFSESPDQVQNDKVECERGWKAVEGSFPKEDLIVPDSLARRELRLTTLLVNIEAIFVYIEDCVSSPLKDHQINADVVHDNVAASDFNVMRLGGSMDLAESKHENEVGQKVHDQYI